MKVNFVGQRDLIERCIDGGLMPPGSAIGMIASGAGLGWDENLPLLLELIDTPDFFSAANLREAHPDLVPVRRLEAGRHRLPRPAGVHLSPEGISDQRPVPDLDRHSPRPAITRLARVRDRLP